MKKPWNEPERDITPEKAITRRRWMRGVGLGGLALAGAGGGAAWWELRPGSQEEVLATENQGAPARGLYPARRSPRFSDAGRPLTVEAAAARYTNFYEFSFTKAVWRYIEKFQPSPWKVEVAGLVANP